MSLAAVTTGLSVVSAVGQFTAGQASAKAEKLASEQRQRELKLQAQAEKTRAAQASMEREEKLARILAAQTAAFGASGLRAEGTPLNIQAQALSQANRLDRVSSLNTDLAVAGYSQQSLAEGRAGAYRSSAASQAAYTSLASNAARIGSSSYVRSLI